jgi:hypothetical protein
MSLRALTSVLDFMPDAATTKARLVAVAVADTVNDDTGYGWPSIDTLARRTGMSRRTVFRALDELEEMGVLTRVDRYEGGRQTSSAYMWRLWKTLPPNPRNDREGCQRDTPGGDSTVTPGVSALSPPGVSAVAHRTVRGTVIEPPE